MKTKFLLTLFLVVFNSALFAQATVYETASEFGNAEYVPFDEAKMDGSSLMLKTADGDVKTMNLKAEKIWGYRNQWGENYRLKNGTTPIHIVEIGAICIYSRIERTETPSTPDVAPKWQENPFRLDRFHSFSIGAEGKIIKFSKSKFLRALKYDPKLYNKFKKYSKENFDELLIKVMEYNDLSR